MPTITHNTVILTIPIYRDEDDDLLNYMTEDDRVLPGDCYGPLIEAGKPVIADVVIRVDTTTDAEGFVDLDVRSIIFLMDCADGSQRALGLSPEIVSDLAEFFRDEIERAGT